MTQNLSWILTLLKDKEKSNKKVKNTTEEALKMPFYSICFKKGFISPEIFI